VVKVEAGLMNKFTLSVRVGLVDWLMILWIPFYPYHFVRAILSNTILSVYHFVLEPMCSYVKL